MNEKYSFILSQKYPEKLLAVTQRITIFAIHYITELSHVGELRDVREVKGQMSCVLRQKAIVP